MRILLDEDENKKLKSLVADVTLDKQHVARGAQKKVLKPVRKRALAEFLCSSFQVSERRAVRCSPLPRSVYYYRSWADANGLRLRLKDLITIKHLGQRLAIVRSRSR